MGLGGGGGPGGGDGSGGEVGPSGGGGPGGGDGSGGAGGPGGDGSGVGRGPGGGSQCRVMKPFSSGCLRSLSLEKTARAIRELGLPTFLSQSFLWEGE